MELRARPGIITTRHPRLSLMLLAFSQLIFAVDFSIVFTALPSIGEALHFSAHDLQWVVSAYTLAVGGFLLLGGRAADLLGRRRMFVLALTIYAAASLAGGLATTQEILIIARATQGLGGALLVPATLSIINTTFAEGTERNRALGVWGAAGASGGAIGVFLGGILTQTLGWEWVLFVNVPIAAAAALTAPWLLPKDAPLGLHAREIIRRFDFPGAVLATVGVLLLVYGLIQGPVRGWTSPATIVPLIGAVVALGAFALVESRVASPLIPFRLIRNRNLVTALLVAFAFMAIFGSQLYLLNLWLQNVRGYGAFEAALAMLPLSFSVIAGTQLGRILTNRMGGRTTLVGGLTIGAIGLFFIAVQLRVDGDYASHLLPGIVVSGLGQGISFTTFWIVASKGVQRSQAGVASGITSTAQQVGSPIGLSILVAIANAGQSTTGGAVLRQQLNDGLQTAFLTTTAIAVIVALAVVVILPTRRHPPALISDGKPA